MNVRGMILTLGLLVVTGIMTGNAQERVGIATGRTVKRGFMGVTLGDLDQDLRNQFQTKNTGGALVTQAEKDSAAGKAGIQANDVIVRYNGQEVKDVQHLIGLIAPTAPGTKVDISLLRDGQEQTLPVILGERLVVEPSPDQKLHDAVDEGDLAAAQAALAEGANVESSDLDRVPLAKAASQGKAKMVRLLLEKGANINVTDNNGKTPMMLAAKSIMASLYGGSYAETVEFLLEKGANVHARDENGNTALHWAIASDSEMDRVAMVKLLLAKGADVNAKGDVWPPLLSASYKGDTKVVRLLLERGADIKTQDRDGFNALDYAIKQGHKEVEQLLLAAGREGARKHMDRGQAAVEIAQSPADLEQAIKELTQATRLAPDSPAPYYNLALLYENTGNYAAAIDHLKQYLRLAPESSDAEKVKSLINKLEYKHEQDVRARTIESVAAVVSGVRFYESGTGGVPLAQRVYASRHPKGKTRFVYWELKLEHHLRLGREDFTIESIWYNPTGQVVFRDKLKSYFNGSWDHSFHNQGYGWPDAAAAGWATGTHRVDLHVAGKKVASGEFVID